jgi:hypothetical protein
MWRGSAAKRFPSARDVDDGLGDGGACSRDRPIHGFEMALCLM